MQRLAEFLFLNLLLSGAIAHAEGLDIQDLKFDLAQVPGSRQVTSSLPARLGKDCETGAPSSLKTLTETLRDPRLPEGARAKMKIARLTQNASGKTQREIVYVFPEQSDSQNASRIGPRIQTGREPRIMGMTAQDAQLASRDGVNMRACSPGHEQGDLANRWCHSLISQTIVDGIFGRDGSPVAKAVVEGFVWAPKEFLVDMNPSAHDLTFTYRDKLGTKRSTFEVTVYGDSVFDNHVTKIKPFSGSTPFLTWKRSLGPR